MSWLLELLFNILMNSRISIPKNNATLLALIAIFVCLAIWFTSGNLFPVSIDFQFNLWQPAYQLVHGQSPYDVRGIFNGLDPLWFPMVIGLFFPLGFLPLQVASNIWLILNAIALFAIVVIITRSSRFSIWLVLAAVLLLGIFPASVGHFKFGQVSLLICLAILLLSKYYQRLHPAIVGFLIAFSLSKPQLTLIFLPVFAFVYYKERGARRILQLILSSLIWIGVLCSPLFIVYPAWVQDLIRNLLENPGWAYPTLFYYLSRFIEAKEILFGITGLFLLIGILIPVFIAFKKDGYEALLWSMAVTPLFSPILFSSDFVLMYPLVLFLVFDPKNKLSSIIVSCGFVICLIVFVIVKSTGSVYSHQDIWVPVSLNLILGIGYLMRNNQIGTETSLTERLLKNK